MKIIMCNNYSKNPALKTLDSIPRTVRIKELRVENKQVKTFVLDCSLGAKPGQFVNLWIPRLDEKPISVAMDDGKEMWFSIAAVGPFSKAMHEKKAGDTVGIRGPFGTTFECEEGQHIAMLAGGYGVAPLYFFASKAAAKGCTVDFIVGARTKDFLLFTERIAALPGVKLHIATDDGSEGHKGYNTQVLEKILPVDLIATCGPEMMMYAAAKMAKERGIGAQVSVERYMKCGMGICGNCCVDGSGVPSCVKGPVMTLEQLFDVEDFGKYHRDALGKKHYF